MGNHDYRLTLVSFILSLVVSIQRTVINEIYCRQVFIRIMHSSKRKYRSWAVTMTFVEHRWTWFTSTPQSRLVFGLCNKYCNLMIELQFCSFHCLQAIHVCGSVITTRRFYIHILWNQWFRKFIQTLYHLSCSYGKKNDEHLANIRNWLQISFETSS